MAMYLGSNKVEIGQSSGGSSDFSTAEVTFINTLAMSVPWFTVPCCYEENELGEGAPAICYPELIISEGQTVVAKVVLYKGTSYAQCQTDGLGFTVTGDIANMDGRFLITGDGTITISQSQGSPEGPQV